MQKSMSRDVENTIKQCCAAHIVQCCKQYCSNYTRLWAGFRPNNLFRIVDNIEQCGQHNIVQSGFQQPLTTHNFHMSHNLGVVTIFRFSEFGIGLG